MLQEHIKVGIHRGREKVAKSARQFGKNFVQRNVSRADVRSLSPGIPVQNMAKQFKAIRKGPSNRRSLNITRR